MAQLWYSPISIKAAQVPSSQTDFPVLVSQVDARFKTTGNGGHVANANGFDIRPYTDTTLGTAITGYQLERYNASTGEVIMWVKVSSLSSSTTPIVLGYGDTSLTTDGSSTSAWDSSFKGVWHLTDGVTLLGTDSTSSAITLSFGNSPTATSGQIDGAGNFLSASNQKANGGLDISAFTAITFSAWVNAISFPNAYNTIGLANSGGTRFVELYVKSTGKLAMYIQNPVKSYDGTGTATLLASTWYLLHLTYDSTQGLIGYVNGVSDGTATASGALTIAALTSVPGDLANDPVNAGRQWNGKIDEVRVSNSARSANWIATEYNNQSSPGSFETLGAEVSLAPSIGLFTFVPFSPLDVAGCTLWLKSSSLVLNDGDPVSTWTDSSGSGHDMSQATGGVQPLYKTSIINSLPSVLFDGSDDFMSRTGTFNIASFFIVTQPTLSTASQKSYACFFHTTGSIFIVAKLSTSFWGVFAGSDVSSTNALTSGSNYLLENTFSAGSVKLYQRGTLLVTSGNTENSGPANTGLGKDLVNANRQYAGYISEVIAYDTVISAANRVSVENYLIARYAL